MKLQRLNMDTSWFLELGGARLLIDPWLEGAEVDYFAWFNKQWHRTPPLPYEQIPDFDAVLLTQKYPDHFHRETLRKLQPTTVFSPRSIETNVKSLLPEATTYGLSRTKPQLRWQSLRIQMLATRRRIDPIYDAFILDDGEQSVVVAPHGLPLHEEHLERLANSPPCRVLLSPFNRYELPALLGGVVTPGMKGLCEMVDALRPAHVVQCHDEPKHAQGLIPKLATITSFDEEDLARFPSVKERYFNIAHYEPVDL